MARVGNSRPFWKRAALVAAVATFVGIAWQLAGRKPASAPPTAVAPARPPTSELQGVDLVDVDPDGTRWRLSARSGSAWEDEETGSLTEVDVRFEKKGNEVRVHAGKAALETGRVVTLSDGVRVSWGEYEADLDRAKYVRGEGVISSDLPVTLRGPGIEVSGRGVQVELEAKRARIVADVRAVIQGAAP